MGAFQANNWVALLAATGMVLGPAYMLYLYRRVIFGKLIREDLKSILDLSPREIAVFAPMVLVVLWMGVYPSSFLTPLHASVGKLIDNYHLAQSAAHAVALDQH
jgi:NADH-quinone oxidoreductase subunit M